MTWGKVARIHVGPWDVVVESDGGDPPESATISWATVTYIDPSNVVNMPPAPLGKRLRPKR